MTAQNFSEPFPIENVLKVLQLPPAEESIVKNYVAQKGLMAFFEHYIQLELSQETLVKVKALAALLEAHYNWEE